MIVLCLACVRCFHHGGDIANVLDANVKPCFGATILNLLFCEFDFGDSGLQSFRNLFQCPPYLLSATSSEEICIVIFTTSPRLAVEERLQNCLLYVRR